MIRCVKKKKKFWEQPATEKKHYSNSYHRNSFSVLVSYCPTLSTQHIHGQHVLAMGLCVNCMCVGFIYIFTCFLRNNVYVVLVYVCWQRTCLYLYNERLYICLLYIMYVCEWVCVCSLYEIFFLLLFLCVEVCVCVCVCVCLSQPLMASRVSSLHNHLPVGKCSRFAGIWNLQLTIKELKEYRMDLSGYGESKWKRDKEWQCENKGEQQERESI